MLSKEIKYPGAGYSKAFKSNLVPPRLCPYMIGSTRLCSDTIVPRHVCAQTRLRTDMIVPRHDCAQTQLCPYTIVPRHI